MPEGFGARLRKQREERHIDLSWIAEQTKIKQSLLEALERDDVSRWPSGIFRRAYIRTYAQFIGLDPDAVLREFLEVYPEPVDALEAAAAAAIEEAARRDAAPAIRLRTIVDSAIGSLARLRRPGATDRPVPGGPPLRGPARTVVDPPAVAPHGSGATLPDATTAPLAEDAAPPSLDRWVTDPTHEPAPQVDADRAAVAPLADSGTNDDGRAQAGASSQDAAVQAPTAHRPPPTASALGVSRALIDSRLEAVANLCTEFGRVGGHDEIVVLLEDAARALDATGLIVWLWDESSDALWPALVHGYSDRVLARLPRVRRDADNATAEAFRSASPCEVAASAQATGALVVPLLLPEGCAGVLAVELQPGIQAPASLRAHATLLAAALAQLVHRSRVAAAQSPPLPGAGARSAPANQ